MTRNMEGTIQSNSSRKGNTSYSTENNSRHDIRQDRFRVALFPRSCRSVNQSKSIFFPMIFSIFFLVFRLPEACMIQAFRADINLQPIHLYTYFRSKHNCNNFIVQNEKINSHICGIHSLAKKSFLPPSSRRNVGTSTLQRQHTLNQNLLRLQISNNEETFTTSNDDIASTSSSSSSSSNKNDGFNDQVYQTAIKRTLLTIAASSLFGISILYWMGPISAQEFFAGYIVEQSLSVDNLFVFLLLFDYFQVPLPYQNRVLNYGIVGAVLMRAIVIALGSAVLHRFKPVLLLFASFLIFSSVSALSEFLVSLGESEGEEADEEQDMENNAIVKFSRSLFPTTDMYDGDRFFTDLDGGVKKATPLLLCLVAVEISDIVFAVDSIPAVFGVTEDSFIVFTSNIFAILGLRSLYTVLSKAAADLEYLEPAVAVVLGFIGIKMTLEYIGICIPTSIALIVVASVLSIGIGFSSLGADNCQEPKELE